MKLAKLAGSYYSGLSRTLKIIEYGNIQAALISRAADEKYRHLKHGRASTFSLLKTLAREIFFERISPFKPGSPEIAFCGSTENNEREFKYTSTLLPEIFEGRNYDRQSNLAHWVAEKKSAIAVNPAIKTLIFITLCVFSARITVSSSSLPTVAKYISRYTKHFLRYYAHFSGPNKNLTPLLAIVANDHSDNPVAFSMIMKWLGVPRLYVQHAEVTKLFPELDFEFSILRNKKSLETYRQIGPIHGEILIAAREERSQDFPRITDLELEPVSIVIYLSSLFSKDALEAAISTLTTNRFVQRVELKKHPRSRPEDFHEFEEIRINEKIPSYPHIAVVPNSSVVVELLHRGIKVFQYFELDDITRDYYGFVAQRIVPEINMPDLEGRFWTTGFYDNEWIQRFKSYDPSIDDSWKKDIGGFSKAVLSRIDHV